MPPASASQRSSYRPSTLLFDLDGTLTDPAEGITRCLVYALQCLNKPVPSDEDLRACIGPPLQKTLPQLLGSDNAALAQDALTLYRQRFASVGKFENTVYPDIPEALTILQKSGYRLLVATSKPAVYAKDIINHFGLDGFFDGLYGSELSGERTDKAELIAHLLAQEKVAASECLMLGDRKHDVEGAHHNGVACVGVLWGYGSADELTKAGADWLCVRPTELLALVASIGTLCE